ncbi:hypothetical protein R6Q59_028095 [Mikania micrantha]
MGFTDKYTDPVSLENGMIEGVLSEMGYKGVYPMLQKKLLIPYWRYIAHVFMVSMSGYKGTYDMLNKDQSSAFVALAMNWGFNFSKFILNEMKGNLRGSKSEKFMMYPKFLQMIFDEKFPNLQRGVVTRDLKLFSESTFPLIMQNRCGKYKFEELHPLKKFGQFAEVEDMDAGEEAEIPNAVVEEERDVQVTGNEPDMNFDFEMETTPVKGDRSEQVNLLTTENLQALLEHVKRSVGNPPPTYSFTDQEPPLDTTADLIPRKRRRRRRDPRPGIVMRELETEITSVTQVPTITIGPTQSVPLVTESTAGPSSHSEDVDYDSFLIREMRTRADKGKNVLPDDEPIDVVKLQSRVFELEQDSLSHTLLIRELKTENEAKDKKIKDLETNMGHQSAIVLDMKQKLQDKFKGEFLDESCSSTAVESEPEMSRAEFDELNRSREEGLRKYFAGETGFKVSMAKFRELMMITERTVQEARDVAKIKPTRFIVDVGDSRFNYEGDRSGIVCWGYDEVKELWWLRRKLTKRIEYYDHPSSFKSLTVVDMVELARQRFFNPSKNKRGESFYTSLQQHVRKGFSDMTLAKSVRIKKTTNSLRNPIDIDVFEVRWPATDWMKEVPILPDLPEGVLDNFKFWAFDEQTYGVIINCGEVEHTFYDPIDLMCLSKKDIKFLNNQEMKVDQDHLEDTLDFVVYVRVIVKNEVWSGGKGDSSTLMIKCGEADEPMKEKNAEETQN